MSMEKQKVKNYLERNDYITTRLAAEMGVKRHTLSNMARRGEIVREKQGVYRAENEVTDEFFLIQSNSEKLVYSYLTALYFHGLTDRTPGIVHITVPQGYNTQHLTRHFDHLIFHYVDDRVFNLGAIEMKSPLGNRIHVYDRERTICDIVKNRKKQDRALFSDAMNRYFRSSEKDLRKLIKYSKALNVEEKVRKYAEVLQ